MIIMKINSVFDTHCIGTVFFSTNPFKVPWFSEVTWIHNDAKELKINSWLILNNFIIGK